MEVHAAMQYHIVPKPSKEIFFKPWIQFPKIKVIIKHQTLPEKKLQHCFQTRRLSYSTRIIQISPAMPPSNEWVYMFDQHTRLHSHNHTKIMITKCWPLTHISKRIRQLKRYPKQMLSIKIRAERTHKSRQKRNLWLRTLLT